MAKNYLKSIDEKMGVIIKAINANKKTVRGSSDRGFIDNGDGTISGPIKGLMWDKNGSGKEMNFEEATEYCKKLNLGGFKDWRLPTVEELLTLVDYTKNDPAINPVFKCKSSWYWTSTPYAGSGGYAWIVGFGGGRAGWDCRDGYNYVRPVRQY